MSELPKKILRLRDLSLRGETVTLFLLRESEIPTVERDDSFRQAFPASTFWATTRKRDFYLGRLALRMAIREVSAVDPGWIPIASDGRPVLPAGLAASLSHTQIDGKRIAIVGISVGSAHRIGVDVEPIVGPDRFTKLAPRFEAALAHLSVGTPWPPLHPETLTAFFTVYEAAVKAIAQWGLGKATPSDFHSPQWNLAPQSGPSDTEWRLDHLASGRTVEGQVFSYERAKIALGIA